MPAAKAGVRKARGKNCYLFLGPELGEKLDALEKIRRGLPKDTEETSFYAGETPVSDIASVIKNGSLFAPSRLFIIKNAEQVKKKDEAELLASCMENPQDDTTLVLISEETKIDKYIEGAVPGENRVIFWELFENKKTEWVAAFFRREGCRIDEGGIAAILEMVENNTDALRRECSRLILFLGKDRFITGEDVEKCLSHAREESAFTLFACLARGNFSGSLSILRALLGAKESTPAILASLAWCFRKFRDYLSLRALGNVNDFELKKIGLGSSKVRSDYIEAAKHWPDADGLLALIGEYEYRLRSSGSALEELLLDKLIYSLVFYPRLRV
jgi:DNA polymerase-3 subunit delta